LSFLENRKMVEKTIKTNFIKLLELTSN
jgi:hypothetical protein